MNTTEENGANLVPGTTGAPILPQTLDAPTPYQRNESSQVPFTNVDAVFALITLACGYFFVWLILPGNLGFGVTLFTALFCVTTLLYFKKRVGTVSKQSVFWLVPVMLSALSFSIFTNDSLQFFNFLFLMGSAVYWIAVLNSTRLDKSLGKYFLSDMMNQFVYIPFHNFGCATKVVSGTVAKNRKSKLLLASFCGALAAIPLIGIVLSLLIQADEAFQTVMEQIIASIGSQLVEFLLRLLPAFLVGSYLYGLQYGNLQKRRIDTVTAEKSEEFAHGCKKLPVAASFTVLCLLSSIYLLFIGTQAVTLFSAFQNQYPTGFTFAQYARRGFFELCNVVFINLGVMVAASFFTVRQDREHKALRVMNVILSFETLLLILTAISKMILYIDQYGLTQKRVYTSCFMILLFVLFCMVILAQFTKINLTKFTVLIFSVSFLILCYANVDGLIVKYNIDRYQNGTLQTLDVGMMYHTPDASKPYALELYHQVSDPKVKKELKDFLQSQKDFHGEFQELNIQKILAQKLNTED